MKKVLAYLLTGLTVLAVTGCSGNAVKNADSEENRPAESESVNGETLPETTDANEKAEDLEAAAGNTDSGEAEELTLLRKYIDVDAYIAGEGRVKENVSDKISDEIQIDGQNLKIGMSYNEVIAAGFIPKDEEFMNTETGALAYTGEFETPSHKTAKLGFIGDEGKTVADGSLYSVSVSLLDESAASFSVMNINESAKIQDIVSVLGEPYSIKDPAWSDFLNAGLAYECKETSRYLTFYVNLETGDIAVMTLEGYAQ